MAKGSILDLVLVIIIPLIVGMTVILSYYLNTEFKSAFETQGITTAPFEYAEQGLLSFNYGFLIIVIGLGIGIILGAFLLPTNPILFFFSLITLAIFIALGAIFSNVFETFSRIEVLSNSVTTFNIIFYVMKNLPFFLLGIGILIIIALYGKGYFTERGNGI